MNPRRRSTVHDLAALRLHRDGTRVLNSDSNRSSRRAKYAVRDARGNWIAHDAGGLGTVKQRRSASRPSHDDEPNAESADEGPHTPSKDKGKGRARDDEVNDELNPRARKRRRFDEDLNYLASASSPAVIPPADSEIHGLNNHEETPGALPVPSSDLLKCLHYFASTYYTAMGQLYDSSREHRKERKARKLEKLKRATKPGRSRRAESEEMGEHEPPHSSGEEEVGLSDEENQDSTDEDATNEQTDAGQVRKEKQIRKKRGPRQLRPMEKDMYKIFDGSALVALGMLFQEHVAEMLVPRVPEGWEKEMAQLEREEKAEAKKGRKAKQMREKRRPTKKDSEEAVEAGDSSEAPSEKEQAGSDGTVSDNEQDAEVSAALLDSNRALKQHSSVSVLESNSETDD
ncbi:hypothetical protein FKP32DRAFT_1583328 [Trametes sanguinea]|nr:hypothetical protein FKP32DRAFT_1583328 [Trametes sanguinea]